MVVEFATTQLCHQPCKRTYDNNTEVDDKCCKNFPSVSYSGFCYMFLWFCPVHGHCYVFHLISDDEGRKDPFSSLYKYKPIAPDELFYNFACQLSEYCFNSALQYFRCTCFWPDIFMVFHISVVTALSPQVFGLTGVNSEICKQFNSYLQSIKYTATHLSQTHLMFFHTNIYLSLEQRKTTKFQKHPRNNCSWCYIDHVHRYLSTVVVLIVVDYILVC